MKQLVRWLFIKFYYAELCDIGKYIRDNSEVPASLEDGMMSAGKAVGGLDTLEKLDLLV